MKANRKFLHGDEEAVSPVIAVILMVAITVVLAATVYVWVSGFGSGGGNTPAHTMALTSGGALDDYDATNPDPSPAVPDLFAKPYTVASADPSLTYGDLKFTFAGIEYDYTALAAGECDTSEDLMEALGAVAATDDVAWGACGGTSERAGDDLVQAGDKIWIAVNGVTNPSGTELIFLDKQANSVMLTLTMR